MKNKCVVGFEISVVFKLKQVFRYPNFTVEDNEDSVQSAINLLKAECERRSYTSLRILTISIDNKRKFVTNEN